MPADWVPGQAKWRAQELRFGLQGYYGNRAPRTVQRTVHGPGPGALKTSAPLLAAQAARMVTPPSRPERGQRGVEAR